MALIFTNGIDSVSPVTTKGDIVVRGTQSQRLPVGADGQVLTADSAMSLGVKWATPAGGGGSTPIGTGFRHVTSGAEDTASKLVDTTDVNDDQITNAKLANVATTTLKGRVTAGTGDPEDLSAAQARTLLNVADGANNYAHPNHTGDVTSVGDGAQVITSNVVTNAKLADVATASIKGRATAGTGDPEDLTGTQVTALLDAFTTVLKGVVPASGGGTTNFLRADGTWAAPAGGGGGPTRLVKTADQASTVTSFANVTDLTFSIAANETVCFEFMLSYVTAATTTALQVAINGPAGPTHIRYTVETSTTATARHNASQSAYDTVVNPATGGGATALPVRVSGQIVNGGTAGTVALRFRSEIAGSSVTIQRGSWGIIYR